jgi:hypothetical protein
MPITATTPSVALRFRPAATQLAATGGQMLPYWAGLQAGACRSRALTERIALAYHSYHIECVFMRYVI